MHSQLFYWIIFNVVVLFLLVLDLGIFHRKSHEIKLREAFGWSIFWIALAFLFNLFIYLYWPFWHDPNGYTNKEAAMVFLTGYLLEKSLSVDNLFVFLIIFSYFQVPDKYRHKVLFWGILGALILRATFILAGVSLISLFHWMIYVFGASLIYSGYGMIKAEGKQIEPDKNPVLNLFRRFVPVTDNYVEGQFFVTKLQTWHATPLFIVLLCLETTDVVFAVDSIPAILGLTQNSFLIYTSNVFAILGLRALYFALAGFMNMFKYLNYGLSAILVFIGSKMLLSDILHISIPISLSVIAIILITSVLVSIIKK